MQLLVNAVLGLSTFLYPLAVYFGSQYLEPWKIASLLIVLLLVRLAVTYSNRHWSSALLLAGIGYCVFSMWSNELGTLRLYPVLVNALMLLVFGWSLFSPPSLIERLARLQHPWRVYNIPICRRKASFILVALRKCGVVFSYLMALRPG
ncbi:MAG: hypothetical protein RIQ94_3478 [Pseudomonadota bacterium]